MNFLGVYEITRSSVILGNQSWPQVKEACDKYLNVSSTILNDKNSLWQQYFKYFLSFTFFLFLIVFILVMIQHIYSGSSSSSGRMCKMVSWISWNFSSLDFICWLWLLYLILNFLKKYYRQDKVKSICIIE